MYTGKCFVCGNNRPLVYKNADKNSKAYEQGICPECTLKLNSVLRHGNISEPIKKMIADFDKCEQTFVTSVSYATNLDEVKKPKEIKEFLDDYVIGQEKGKKTIAVAVYNHYKRIYSSSKKIKKSNILLMGPTGSGKTLMAQTIAQLLDVPFAIADATTLTETGYVGADVESILVRLIHNANGDIKKAEHGIVYIDEFDKITCKSENTSITRDVSGEGVQQALLKLIEGNKVVVPISGGHITERQKTVEIDTSNILFICGGAFAHATKGKKETHLVGFGRNEERVTEKKTVTSNNHYGIIPELMGRLPVTITLTEPTKEDMLKIMTEPKNNIIDEYKELLLLDDVTLTFTEEALEEIVEAAMKKGTGVRAIRSVLEEVMQNIMYDIPSMEDPVKECIIMKDTIYSGIPKLIMRNDSEECLRIG